MNLAQAHNIVFKHSSKQNQECRCHSCDKAMGYIEAYQGKEFKALIKFIETANYWDTDSLEKAESLLHEFGF